MTFGISHVKKRWESMQVERAIGPDRFNPRTGCRSYKIAETRCP
jgi:hypothetical protein